MVRQRALADDENLLRSFKVDIFVIFLGSTMAVVHNDTVHVRLGDRFLEPFSDKPHVYSGKQQYFGLRIP